MWLQFFRDAGIVPDFDTQYAFAFEENRIRTDMLLDMDKETLREMGIVAMGDIISILRHAMKVHQESKVKASEVPMPIPTDTNSTASPTVTRIVTLKPKAEDLTRLPTKDEPQVLIPVSSQKVVFVDNQILQEESKPTKNDERPHKKSKKTKEHGSSHKHKSKHSKRDKSKVKKQKEREKSEDLERNVDTDTSPKEPSKLCKKSSYVSRLEETRVSSSSDVTRGNDFSDGAHYPKRYRLSENPALLMRSPSTGRGRPYTNSYCYEEKRTKSDSYLEEREVGRNYRCLPNSPCPIPTVPNQRGYPQRNQTKLFSNYGQRRRDFSSQRYHQSSREEESEHKPALPLTKAPTSNDVEADRQYLLRKQKELEKLARSSSR